MKWTINFNKTLIRRQSSESEETKETVRIIFKLKTFYPDLQIKHNLSLPKNCTSNRLEKNLFNEQYKSMKKTHTNILQTTNQKPPWFVSNWLIVKMIKYKYNQSSFILPATVGSFKNDWSISKGYLLSTLSFFLIKTWREKMSPEARKQKYCWWKYKCERRNRWCLS